MRRIRNASRLGTLFLSIGLSVMLVFAFMALGGFGMGPSYAMDALDQGGNPHNDASTNTHIGGNVNNTHPSNTASITVSGVVITTRQQSGQPTRVCVEHVVNGRTNVENYDPFHPGGANDIVIDLIRNGGGPRVQGNQTWQLCGAAGTTTTTGGTTTGGTTTGGTTTGGTTNGGGGGGETTTTVAVVTTEAVVTTTPAAVVAGVTIAAPVSTVEAVALPAAGGIPLAPGALAGLGLLFSIGGLALRRLARR